MSNPILTGAIDALASGKDLSSEQAAEVLDEIMHGEVSETQIAGFLIALRTKGETVQEVTGLARTISWYRENEAWWRGIMQNAAQPVSSS